jgi:hypothetical protein
VGHHRHPLQRQVRNDEEASTWDVIRNPKFADRIFIKDSARDVYSQIIMKVKERELADSTLTMDELMNFTSDEDIAAVEEYMKQVKPLVAGWRPISARTRWSRNSAT